MPGNFAPFESKMRADGLSDAAVAAFKNAYDALTSGALQRCTYIEGRLQRDSGPPTSLVGNHWPGGTRGALRCRCDAQSNATAARRTRCTRAPTRA